MKPLTNHKNHYLWNQNNELSIITTSSKCLKRISSQNLVFIKFQKKKFAFLTLTLARLFAPGSLCCFRGYCLKFSGKTFPMCSDSRISLSLSLWIGKVYLNICLFFYTKILIYLMVLIGHRKKYKKCHIFLKPCVSQQLLMFSQRRAQVRLSLFSLKHRP